VQGLRQSVSDVRRVSIEAGFDARAAVARRLPRRRGFEGVLAMWNLVDGEVQNGPSATPCMHRHSSSSTTEQADLHSPPRQLSPWTERKCCQGHQVISTLLERRQHNTGEEKIDHRLLAAAP